MTLRELKQLTKDLPDETIVLVSSDDSPYRYAKIESVLPIDCINSESRRYVYPTHIEKEKSIFGILLRGFK